MAFNLAKCTGNGIEPNMPSCPETPIAEPTNSFNTLRFNSHSFSLAKRATSSMTSGNDTPSLIRALSNASPTPLAASAAAAALNLAINAQHSNTKTPTARASARHGKSQNESISGSQSHPKQSTTAEPTSGHTLSNNLEKVAHSITSLPPAASSRQMLLTRTQVQPLSLFSEGVVTKGSMNKLSSETPSGIQAHNGNSTSKGVARKLFTNINNYKKPLPYITSNSERHHVSRLGEERSKPSSAESAINFAEMEPDSSKSVSPGKYVTLKTNNLPSSEQCPILADFVNEDSAVTGRGVEINNQNDNITTVPDFKTTEDDDECTDDDAICSAMEPNANIAQAGRTRCDSKMEESAFASREKLAIDDSDMKVRQDWHSMSNCNDSNYTHDKANVTQTNLSNNQKDTEQKTNNMKLNLSLDDTLYPTNMTHDKHCDSQSKVQKEMSQPMTTVTSREDEDFDNEVGVLDLCSMTNLSPNKVDSKGNEKDRLTTVKAHLFMEDNDLELDASREHGQQNKANGGIGTPKTYSKASSRKVAKGIKMQNSAEEESSMITTPKITVQRSAHKNTKTSLVKSGSGRPKRQSSRNKKAAEEPEEIMRFSEDNLMNNTIAEPSHDGERNRLNEATLLNPEIESNNHPVKSVGRSAAKRRANVRRREPKVPVEESPCRSGETTQKGIASEEYVGRGSETGPFLETTKQWEKARVRTRRNIIDELSEDDEVEESELDKEDPPNIAKSGNSSREAIHLRSKGLNMNKSLESRTEGDSLSEERILSVSQVDEAKEGDEIEHDGACASNETAKSIDENEQFSKRVRKIKDANVKTSAKKSKVKPSGKKSQKKSPSTDSKIDKKKGSSMPTSPTPVEGRDVNEADDKKRKRPLRKKKLSEVFLLQKSLASAAWTDSRAVEKQTEVIPVEDNSVRQSATDIPVVVKSSNMSNHSSDDGVLSTRVGTGMKGQIALGYGNDDNEIDDDDDDDAILIAPPPPTKKYSSSKKVMPMNKGKPTPRRSRHEKKKSQLKTNTLQDENENFDLKLNENDNSDGDDRNSNSPVELCTDKHVKKHQLLRTNATRAVRRGGAVRSFVGSTRSTRTRRASASETLVQEIEKTAKTIENHDIKCSSKNDEICIIDQEETISPVLTVRPRKFNTFKSSAQAEQDTASFSEEEIVCEPETDENGIENDTEKMLDSVKVNSDEKTQIHWRKRKSNEVLEGRTPKRAKVSTSHANNNYAATLDDMQRNNDSNHFLCSLENLTEDDVNQVRKDWDIVCKAGRYGIEGLSLPEAVDLLMGCFGLGARDIAF